MEREAPAIAIDTATVKILEYCLTPRKRVEVLKKLGISKHPKNYQRYILPLIEKRWLAYTEPDILTSSNQRYVTTAEGKAVLAELTCTPNKCISSV